MKIDNFALTMHQTCPAKFDLRINQEWTVRRRSGALGFGAALHEGLCTWYKTGELSKSLVAIAEAWPQEHPIDDYRTREKCIQTMMDYVKTYPTESFKVIGYGTDDAMVEKTFSLETGLYLSCWECGPDYEWDGDGAPVCPNCGAPVEPIEYGGIFDTLVEFGGRIFILEHKSTSVLGPTYFHQFKPNNQVTGYVWGASKLSGRPVGGAIINAIGIYKSSSTKFERSITTRSPADIEEWLRNVKAVCEEIQQHRRTGFWPMRTSACTLYGICEFHSVHTLSHPTEREARLQTDYVKHRWDHEFRDENSNKD